MLGIEKHMEATQTTIRKNLERVRTRMIEAAQSAGRDINSTRLVVVTKGQPVSVIRAAVEAGATILGENYPEETLPKMQEIGMQPGLSWHMIGHLQSRKAGLVAVHFDTFESLDNLPLAQKLERILALQNRRLPVLLEFNVGGEESKYGWDASEERHWERLLGDVENVLHLPHLEVRGLMTMPPFAEDPETSRPYFDRLRRLADYFSGRFQAQSFSELSMGTSGDFEVAIQEGATLIRLGTAILGPRPPKRSATA